jgi:hypothetical protein
MRALEYIINYSLHITLFHTSLLGESFGFRRCQERQRIQYLKEFEKGIYKRWKKKKKNEESNFNDSRNPSKVRIMIRKQEYLQVDNK